MTVAFFLQALFLTSVATLGHRGDVWFVVTMALVFLTWGELYVLFPAMLADTFGARHAASNYSFLYSTKAWQLFSAEDWPPRCSKKRARELCFYGSAALALCSALWALGLRRMPLR